MQAIWFCKRLYSGTLRIFVLHLNVVHLNGSERPFRMTKKFLTESYTEEHVIFKLFVFLSNLTQDSSQKSHSIKNGDRSKLTVQLTGCLFY